MILVEGKDQRFCIDADEAAGPDHMPRVGVTQAQAEAACTSQGKRLCFGREWELACRGPNRASYPWGGKPSSSNMYCNLGPGRAIRPVGSFAECTSASGARDMAGNVAEWVAEGQLRGGSALVTGDGRCSRPLKMTDDRPLDDAGFRCCADPAP
jgi:formylglycine-generating enzyme required for sulfatase activity